MRLSLRRPTDETIQQFLSQQAEVDFSYAAVGATQTTPPLDYNVDHTRVMLGKGREVAERAADAIRQWRQFELGWVHVGNPNAPIAPGATVAVVGRNLGLWTMHACRIVYVVDERESLLPIWRFGFAYGTLPCHAESGEERFMVEWDRRQETVYYDILAFSRPRHLLARIGFPLVRRWQKRFARDSAAAMQKAVIEGGLRPER